MLSFFHCKGLRYRLKINSTGIPSAKIEIFFLQIKESRKVMAYKGYSRQTIDFWTALEIMDNDESVKVNTQFEMITGETVQEKLNTLSKCKCCDRHETNKPKNYVPWIECENNGMSDKTYVQCECDCRHLARIICRMCN